VITLISGIAGIEKSRYISDLKMAGVAGFEPAIVGLEGH
jgi:hypothetical protein